jgi:Ca2+-binding EF-hand superfamily protein
MFQALDVNQDGFICAQDLDRWLAQNSSPTMKPKTGSRCADSRTLCLDEVAAFLHTSSSNDAIQSSSPGSLSEDGLAMRLAQFPALAFDWKAPLPSADGHKALEGNLFNHEAAAALFRRLDSDGDGLVKAADLRVWRRMLPLGRPEDDLVKSVFKPKGANTNVSTTPEAQNKSISPQEAVEHRGIKTLNFHAGESPGLRSWDFYMSLRDDPMLTVELRTQAALLDFIVAGVHKDDSKPSNGTPANLSVTDIVDLHYDDDGLLAAELDFEGARAMKGSLARPEKTALYHNALRISNNVPSDSTISAFVCVAKLKLCRMASAYREVDAHEISIVANIHRALDVAGSGYISAQNMLKYLQKHANMYNVAGIDVRYLLNDGFSTGVGNSNPIEAGVSATGRYGRDDGIEVVDHLVDQEALRKILCRPALRNFAYILHHFVEVEQKLTSRQGSKMAGSKGLLVDHTSRSATSAAPDLPRKQSELQKRFEASQANIVTREHRLSGQHSKHRSTSVASVAASNQPDFTPIFDAEMCEKQPRAFGQVALQKWFKELDTNQDGVVSSIDLKLWCITTGCQHLVDEADLESLFRADLPDFSSPPARVSSLHTVGDLTTTERSDDDEKVMRMSSHSPTVTPGRSMTLAHFSTSAEGPLHTESNRPVVSNLLNEVELAVALARRPLLAARLALMRRVSRAEQAMLHAEACATSALTAAGSSATANTWAAAAQHSFRERAQAAAKATRSDAHQAAVRARSAIAEVHTICGRGRNGMKSSKISGEDAALMRDLEVRIEEAEADDPCGIPAYAARRALQDHFLMKARQNVTSLSMEVAMKVKLLTWREAEHYPIQLQQVRALPPSSSANQQPPPPAKRQAYAQEEGIAGLWNMSEVAVEATATVERHEAKIPAASAQENFMSKLSTFIRSSIGHSSRMALFLDEEEQKKCKKGKDLVLVAAEGVNKDSRIYKGAHRVNLVDEGSQGSKDRGADQRREDKTRRKAPPRPPTRQRLQQSPTRSTKATNSERRITTSVSSVGRMPANGPKLGLHTNSSRARLAPNSSSSSDEESNLGDGDSGGDLGDVRSEIDIWLMQEQTKLPRPPLPVPASRRMKSPNRTPRANNRDPLLEATSKSHEEVCL